MRTFSCHPVALIGAMLFPLLATAPADANDNRLYLNQNTTGLNLPGVSLPGGHDEVRAADGTTCRTAVAGSGAYFDGGIIGNGANSSMDRAASVYGRLVIPLSARRERIDCKRLYDLEIDRLKAEIDFLRAGGGRMTKAGKDGKDWAKKGWH